MRVGKFALLVVAALLLAATPSWAGRVDQGGSGKGILDPSCLPGDGNCETSSSLPSLSVDLNGTLTSLTAFQFTFSTGDDPGDGGIYDVFTLPTTAGETVAITYGGNFGLFLCGGNNTQVVDSIGTPLAGLPCSQNANSTASFVSQTGDFVFANNPSLPGSYAFYVDATNGLASGIDVTTTQGSTGVPEPATLSLIGAGMLFGALRRRRLAS